MIVSYGERTFQEMCLCMGIMTKVCVFCIFIYYNCINPMGTGGSFSRVKVTKA
jgi:hypothetical protein